MNNTIGLNNPLDKLYPVGSIYLTLSEANPKDLFGGVWQKIEDVFLLGSGKKTLNTRGGEEEVTLTVNQMPKHSHNVNIKCETTEDIYATPSALHINYDSWETDSNTHGRKVGNYFMGETNEIGKGERHNNMPPYLTVNMWQRIE